LYNTSSKTKLKRIQAQGIGLVNILKKSIKFSDSEYPSSVAKLEDDVDIQLVQILLLGFLEDYDTLINLFNTSKLNLTYRLQIHQILA